MDIEKPESPTIPPPAPSPTPRSDVENIPPLVPVRMLNEFAYCPRLFYLEWVESDFRDNVFTVDGRHQHRRVDREEGEAPPAENIVAEDRVRARAIRLSAPALGLVTRIDLLEADGTSVIPVDYKRGKKPNVPEGAWEPERVQVCAQALVLRENGYSCRNAAIYFVESHERVEVLIDEALVERSKNLLGELRQAALRSVPPPPLVDSPKCFGCSLSPICLPDETGMLTHRRDQLAHPPRQLLPARDDAQPLYVQAQGAKVRRDRHVLRIEPRDGPAVEARPGEISHVALIGNVQITSQALGELCDRGIAVCHFSTGGWLRGITSGMLHKNVELRRLQYRAADDPEHCLALARRFVFSKIRNCRTMVRRNHPEPSPLMLKEMARLAAASRHAVSVESLLGIEGAAARAYFSAIPAMIRQPQLASAGGFSFEGRNRRPPRDPVNAMLSLAYAVLARELSVTLQAIGLDPYLGFYHQPRYGRPALALDMMEEFRPLIADSSVLSAINTGVVGDSDFIVRAGGCALTSGGRGKFLESVERRLSQEVTHPVFGYRVTYRRILEVQARLLARHLTGEIPQVPPFLTR